jgi:hypothetical protein
MVGSATKEGTGYLAGGQSAEQAQGERHLRVGGQRWMAAGEDQTQPVVLHGPYLLGRGLLVAATKHRDFTEQLTASRLSAQPVDGAVAGGRGDPPARVGWQALARPPVKREGERLLDRIFGDIDVAEDADQGGHRPPGRLAEDPADLGLVHPRRGVGCCVGVAHDVRPLVRPRTGAPRSAPR